MPDFEIKAFDRLPMIKVRLKLDGVPVDLTTATGVDFIMRKDGAPAPKVNAPVNILDDLDGVVEYPWLATDTDEPDTYRAEWEVTWADGKTETFPTNAYYEIVVYADLDEAA